LLPHEIGISVSYPLPGTVFYNNVKAQLENKSNWTDSDELALMFRNTYSAPFYKQLHRYVHSNYRKHQALQMCNRILKKPQLLKWKSLKKAASLLYYAPATWKAGLALKKLELQN
jgi:hypothetical protein